MTLSLRNSCSWTPDIDTNHAPRMRRTAQKMADIDVIRSVRRWDHVIDSAVGGWLWHRQVLGLRQLSHVCLSHPNLWRPVPCANFSASHWESPQSARRPRDKIILVSEVPKMAPHWPILSSQRTDVGRLMQYVTRQSRTELYCETVRMY